MQRWTLVVIVCSLLVCVPVGVFGEQAEQTEQLEVIGLQDTVNLTYQVMEEGKLLVSVSDAQKNPIKGLTEENFILHKETKKAKIVSVEPLATSEDVGLNIVMVVDNSYSMKKRKAVKPLSNALEAFYKTLRPIDNVHAVVFDERSTIEINEKALHAKGLKAADVNQLRSFIDESMHKGMTEGTYLHDAMVAGLDIVRKMPAKSNKFMVVFSDGQDINSKVRRPDVEQAATNIPNFSAYAVDYMPTAATDPFLDRFSKSNSGRTWKASSAKELLPVFESFSSTLLHRYVVNYRFLNPPTGTMAFATPKLTIEEITTIDSAPLLNYIFFETNQSELSGRYALLENQNANTAFAEKNLKGAMDKYRHVLNIIGKRLQTHQDATIRIVGCNSNVGEEKGRSDLSLQRAEAVRSYLRYMWNIGTERMTIEHRNLPQMPSTNRIPEGQAENQRVEIYSDHSAILDTVNSAYVQKVSNQDQLQIVPAITSEVGITDWKVALHCGTSILHIFKGQGDLPQKLNLPLEADLINQMADCGSVRTSIQATDKETNVFDEENAASMQVSFLKRKEQMAQKQGYKVKEQYALILFDFDSATIKERNQIIVDRIIKRIKEKPDAIVSVVGHTDSIGKEEYNLTLSQKRANAVKKQVLARAALLAEKLHVAGAGPHAPLYDNQLPEGRALNRTVTVTLEYLDNAQ